MPFATTQIDLEGVVLSAVSQTEKANTGGSHSYVESKRKRKNKNKTKLIETEKRQVVAEVIGDGQNGWVGAKGTNVGL